MIVKNGRNLKALILIKKVAVKICKIVNLAMDGKNMIIILQFIKLENVIKKIANLEIFALFIIINKIKDLFLNKKIHNVKKFSIKFKKNKLILLLVLTVKIRL